MLSACARRKVDTSHIRVVPGGQTAVIEMLLNGRDRVHHRADKGVMIPYQPTGEDMDFIRSQGQEMEANEEIITFTENAMKEDEEKDEGKGRRASKYDELLPDAVNLVMSTGQASASSLQRRFRVGYTRAARLIDEMEDLSIVGPNIGSKPREILMNSEQAAAVLAECSDS